MTEHTTANPRVKPTASTANPRDGWPDWTDDDLWFPTPVDPDAYQPSPEEQAEAARIFADDMPPPLGGRRSRMMTRSMPTHNNLTDEGIWPGGVC